MPANFAVPLLLYFWPQTGRLTPTLAGCNIKIGLNAYQKRMILTPKYKKFSGEGAVPFPRPYSSIPVRHAQPLRGLQSFDPPPCFVLTTRILVSNCIDHVQTLSSDAHSHTKRLMYASYNRTDKERSCKSVLLRYTQHRVHP